MKVLVGVCGSIAAYKAAELVRLLQGAGVEVEVALTEAAAKFVTPLTFAALTGRQVYGSLWQPTGEAATGDGEGFEIEHITVAQRADVVVIAPATANTLAKLAHGFADDFLSAACLATKAPLVIAPAMNVNMWEHPATQANVRLLEERGARFVAPDAGYLACGMVGSGRLASVELIAEEVLRTSGRQEDLAHETVLITAGGTREAIDPVRFLGNRSSGKMGHALAEEAASRGAKVVLVTSSEMPMPAGCERVQVESASEMERAVMERLPEATVVIKAAAVADFRVREVSANKLRRKDGMVLELEPTEDIARKVAERRREGTLVIAFAAETENLLESAREKLRRKGADAIVANDVSVEGLGIGAERNAGVFLTADNEVVLPESSKREMARRILDEVVRLRRRVLVG